MKTISKLLLIGSLLITNNLMASENKINLKEVKKIETSINKYVFDKCSKKYSSDKKRKECLIITRLYFNTQVLNKLNQTVKVGQNDK